MTSMAIPRLKKGASNGQETGEDKFPLPALLALASSGFITILTEALPAGLLPQISRDMNVSHAAVGQMVTFYAAGSLLAAIPLTRATQRFRRRPMLSLAIAGFAVSNLVTALSHVYPLTMAARFVAGVSAGLLWALLAGYAARMVPEAKKGRAIAVAMAGTPLALSIGVPAATFLGTLIGWRTSFILLSMAALLLSIIVAARLPDFPAQASDQNISLLQTARIEGVRPILFMTLTFVLAHNVLYTYIAPLLLPARMQGSTDIILLLFGLFSLLGIWVVGIWVDRWPWFIALASCSTLMVATIILSMWLASEPAVYLAAASWGAAFGGAATIFQTGMARAAPQQTDIAQSMLVTVWNLAIAGGGILGGLMLEGIGVFSLAPMALVVVVACLSVIVVKSTNLFKI